MRTEKVQSESEKRYRMLFTNMTDGFGLVEVIYDRESKPYDFRFLEINPAYELILGIERERLLGKTMLETFPNVSPIALEKYSEASLSGQPIHFEIFSHVASKYLDIYVFSPEKGKLALILRDITERKQLEEQTRMRAEEMEKIMDVVPVPILVSHDPQGHNITGNRMANEFYEAEVGENISASTTQSGLFFSKRRELPANELPIQQAALKDMDVRNVELDVLLPCGKWRRILVSASPLHDAEGHVRSSVGAFIDITERKEAETKLKETLDNLENLVKERTAELENACKSLKESERGLAEAQKMAHIGNWEWDIEDDKAYWSDELYRIFKSNPKEGAPSYNEYLNYIRPDDRDRFDNSVKETLKGKTHITEDEHRIVLVGGEERTVHMEVEVIFDERNIPAKVKGIIQDITERKQMEETLRQSEKLLFTFLEQLPVGLGLADPHGRWLVSNTMLRRFVGDRIPSLDPVNKQHWKTWGADGRLLKDSQWPSMRALRGEHVIPGLDFLYTSDDGQEKWMRVSSVPFHNETGEITGVISVMQDIDEQKKAQEALEKIEEIRIKEIHHRIKNNLQVISSLLDLQAETFSSHKVCKVPEVLEAFMESQNRIISMALIHEELYKGDKIDSLDFSTYLRKLTADLFSSYNLGDKDISLKLNLDQIYLGMDTAIPLGIIVNELVSNSFKHAFPVRRKQGEIQISLSRTEAAIAKNEISDPDKAGLKKSDFEYILIVADNGKGIPEEIDFQNSGSLGLQLVNILVEQIDGCIELRRGNGTEFAIWFNNI